MTENLQILSSFLVNYWPTCIFGVVLLTIIHRRLTSPLAHLPGPELSKWTGLVHTYYYLSGTSAQYVHQLHKTYGPIVRVHPGFADICDTEAVKEIHKSNARYLKTDFYPKLVAARVDNVFSACDPKFHTQRRRLLASPISATSLVQHEPLITEKIHLTIRRMSEEISSRGATDVYKWWVFMASDIIAELSFGNSSRMLESGTKNQYSRDLDNVLASSALRVTFPFLMNLFSYLPLPIVKNTAAAGKRLGVYASQSVQRYRDYLAENPLNPKQSLFAKVYDSGLSDAEIQEEAANYIVAGSDTTACTMTYLVYRVSQNKRVREKLVAELANVPEPVTDGSLRGLPYLDQVITEALRLHSPAPAALPRLVPVEGATFTGFDLPGGVTVGNQSYSLHRDPNIFPDPESFYPERWEKTTEEMRDASMAFGRGTRICLGIHLARMELRLATALFFRALPNTQVSTKEGMCESDMEMRATFLSGPKGRRCLIETE